jgi:hypothetical protein
LARRENFYCEKPTVDGTCCDFEKGVLDFEKLFLVSLKGFLKGCKVW